MKKKSILRVTALIAALLMLCACQKAVPAGGEAKTPPRARLPTPASQSA